MGSPLGESGWTNAASYYTGAGSGETLWLLVSIGLCVVALVAGIVHERHAYERVEEERR